MIKLTAGSFSSLLIAPQMGGSIRNWVVYGRNIFRPSPEDQADITDMACFPMVPWVNRIANNAFSWDDSDIVLSQTHPAIPLAIHGKGWVSSWGVTQQSESQAMLNMSYPGGDWPWAFDAQQTFLLDTNRLHITLSVTNTSDNPMPASLGLHPHFPTSEHSRLSFKSAGFWETDENDVAQSAHRGAFKGDFISGDLVDAAHGTDHSFYGWDGVAILSEPDKPDITIRASDNCGYFHLYAPEGQNFAALEPATSRSNPFLKGHPEYSILDPGETLSIWMRVDVG